MAGFFGGRNLRQEKRRRQMIFQDSKGHPSFANDNVGRVVIEAEINRIQAAIKIIEQKYECINPEQLDKLRAMTGHLMAMISAE
jgi:hypothetical protein